MMYIFRAIVLSLCFFQSIQALPIQEFLRIADTVEQEGIISPEDLTFIEQFDFSNLIDQLKAAFPDEGYSKKELLWSSTLYLKNLLKEYERAHTSGLLRTGKIALLRKEWFFSRAYHNSKNFYLRVKDASIERSCWNASDPVEKETDMPPGNQFFCMFIAFEIMPFGIEKWKDVKRIFSSVTKNKQYALQMYQCEQIVLRRKIARDLRSIAAFIPEERNTEVLAQQPVSEDAPIAKLLRKYTQEIDDLTSPQCSQGISVVSKFIEQELPHLVQQIKDLLNTGTQSINALDSDGFSALMYATMAGLDEVISILLENGANPFQQADADSGMIALDFLHGPQGDFINGNHMSHPYPLLMSAFGNMFGGELQQSLFGDRKQCLFLLCNAMYSPAADQNSELYTSKPLL